MEAILINNKKYEISKVNKAVKLNAKEKRKVMKINSKKMFHLSREDRQKIKEQIRNTHIWVVDTKSHFECKAVIDLTESGIKESFKNFDDPDFPIVELDNNFYFVRPEEQTKPERQTGVYQLEQLLDILKGTKKAQATFIIKTDEDYEGKIYCYDGQHQLLLMVEFLLFGREFKTKDLQKAIDVKKDYFGEKWWSSNCPNSWKLIEEFLEVYKEESFSSKDLTDVVPEIKEVFSDSDIVSVYGNVHFCDSKTASLLNKKINEHLTSHSTTQRVKSDLVGTLLHNLLFKRDYKVTEEIKGKLSKIVPLIPLFNRGDNLLPEELPETFSYDTSSDISSDMNYDQYLKVIYSCILSKTKFVKETDDDGNIISTNYVFDVKTKLDESYMWTSKGFKDGLIKPYGISEDIQTFWMNGLSKLVIKDESQFVKYIENVIKLCYNLSTEDNVNFIWKFDNKLNDMLKPVREKIKNIKTKYPNPDKMPPEIEQKLTNFTYYRGCMEDFKLKKGHQLLPMMFMILNTHYVSKFSIEDWTTGFLNTIVDEFDSIIEGNKKEWIKRKKRATFSRMCFLYEKYDNKAFSNRVSDLIRNQDKSLWTRLEAMDYIDNILYHTDEILYKCPHTGKNVTTDNFVSHHLSFRSKGDANKVFDFWFPLSSKYNLFISDKKDKNIVKNSQDGSSGNFIDACETMINLLEIKIKNSEGKNQLEWLKSKGTMEQWIRAAEMVIK